MAARVPRKHHDVEQTKKIAPFITHEAPLVNISASWFVGDNIFDVDLRVQVDSVKQSIDNAEVYYPHGNIVDSHSCDECTILVRTITCEIR